MLHSVYLSARLSSPVTLVIFKLTIFLLFFTLLLLLNYFLFNLFLFLHALFKEPSYFIVQSDQTHIFSETYCQTKLWCY